MKNAVVIMVVSIASAIQFATPVFAADDTDKAWEQHYMRAEQAYDRNNLFEARRQFTIALKEAEECREHEKLAVRLETLATKYRTQDKSWQAEPLLKLVRKLKEKFARAALCVASNQS